jgi:hypothetical protein
MSESKIHMFLYIIEAANLPSKDEFSLSDPYLIVKFGGDKVLNVNIIIFSSKIK